MEQELATCEECPEHVLGGLASGGGGLVIEFGAGSGTMLFGGLVEGSEVSGVFGAVWRAG